MNNPITTDNVSHTATNPMVSQVRKSPDFVPRRLEAPDPPNAAARPPPKPTMKMCELCLTSLPEREVVEHEGRKICPECRGNLLRKSGKAT
jgi:hypothetical protein